jgi:hypothetical protein
LIRGRKEIEMSEKSELSDAIEMLQNPDALSLTMIEGVATDALNNWLSNPKRRRAIPHRLARLGYSAVVNPDSKNRSTLWRINKVSRWSMPRIY